MTAPLIGGIIELVPTYEDIVNILIDLDHFPEEEARAIIDFALSAGYTLENIMRLHALYGADVLIITTWRYKTFGGPVPR